MPCSERLPARSLTQISAPRSRPLISPLGDTWPSSVKLCAPPLRQINLKNSRAVMSPMMCFNDQKKQSNNNKTARLAPVTLLCLLQPMQRSELKHKEGEGGGGVMMFRIHIFLLLMFQNDPNVFHCTKKGSTMAQMCLNYGKSIRILIRKCIQAIFFLLLLVTSRLCGTSRYERQVFRSLDCIFLQSGSRVSGRTARGSICSACA